MLKILVVNIVPTYVGSRTLSALSRSGFEVDIIGYSNSIFHSSDHVSKSYKVVIPEQVRANKLAQSLVPLVSQSAPDFLVCQDSAAYQILRLIAWGQNNLETEYSDVVALARKAIGGEDYCELKSLRRQLPILLKSAGLFAIPQHSTADCSDMASNKFAASHDYNLLIKQEGRQNGEGVKRVRSKSEFGEAVAVQAGSRDRSTTLQKYVDGGILRHSLVALDGKVLAQFTAEQIKTRYDKPFQAPTVIQIVDDSQVREQADKFVGRHRLSGYIGMDFIREDKTGCRYLIDVNPRINSLTHLGALAGQDLSQSLHDALAGGNVSPSQTQQQSGAHATIFPYEWLRDRNSQYLQSEASDTPWDDLGVLRRILTSIRL